MSTNGNAALYFVDRHANGAAAEKVAFKEADAGEREIAYGELGAETGRMVDLFQRFGIRREERVALLALDEIDWPIVFWGGLKAGVVPVALNTLLATDVYEVILNDCRARALFVSAALLPVVEPLLEGHATIEHVFVIGGDAGEGQHDFRAELAKCAPLPAVEVSGDDCAFWLYSSGSTGVPKGVRHVHSSLKATADTYGAQVLGVEESDVVYSVAKLFFAYGLGNAMTFPMSVGGTTVLFAGRPTPEAAVEVMERCQPTIFCGVPTLYAAMVAHLQGLDAVPKTPLRRCISAGEALPAEIGERWKAIWGVDILDGVGSTEMLHIFLSNHPDDVTYGASGVAVPGYELRLVDEEGAEVATDEVGELLVNGASAADGYWNQRARSRATFEGVWTRTGDKYTRDAAGKYTYCGRTDDMFKVSGIWVAPFEVEQALIGHDDVLEAAVVPRMDEEDLLKPAAFVVLKEGRSSDGLAEELKRQVQEKAGMWKYPRWVEFVDDLPKTATGKIQRFKLRDPA